MQALLMKFHLCGSGNEEVSVEGPTVGILHYQDPKKTIHVIKLMGCETNVAMIAIWHVTTSTDKYGLTFTGLEVYHNYAVLEYVGGQVQGAIVY